MRAYKHKNYCRGQMNHLSHIINEFLIHEDQCFFGIIQRLVVFIISVVWGLLFVIYLAVDLLQLGGETCVHLRECKNQKAKDADELHLTAVEGVDVGQMYLACHVVMSFIGA
jgi:hypothetical protein